MSKDKNKDDTNTVEDVINDDIDLSNTKKYSYNNRVDSVCKRIKRNNRFDLIIALIIILYFVCSFSFNRHKEFIEDNLLNSDKVIARVYSKERLNNKQSRNSTSLADAFNDMLGYNDKTTQWLVKMVLDDGTIVVLNNREIFDKFKENEKVTLRKLEVKNHIVYDYVKADN